MHYNSIVVPFLFDNDWFIRLFFGIMGSGAIMDKVQMGQFSGISTIFIKTKFKFVINTVRGYAELYDLIPLFPTGIVFG